MERKISIILLYNSKKQILLQHFEHPDVSGTLYVFTEEYDGSRLVLKEGQGMDWFFPEEMKNLKMADHDLEVIRKIRNNF